MGDKVVTAVVEARVDIRDLASCAAYFINECRPPTSRSDLIWLCIRLLADSVQDKYPRMSTEEAHGYLSGLNLGSFHRKGRKGELRGLVNLTKAIETERRAESEEDEMKRIILETMNRMRGVSYVQNLNEEEK